MGITKGDLQVGIDIYSKRNPGKLYNTFCYTYLTKDQPPPRTIVITIKYTYSSIDI